MPLEMFLAIVLFEFIPRILAYISGSFLDQIIAIHEHI